MVGMQRSCGLVLGLLLALVAAACTSTIDTSQTAAERFRARYDRLKRECERNPPAPGDARCNLLKVEIEDPMATPEGRFAHSIVIPNPMPADTGYKPGMTPGEYFEHLCKNYAGDFIFKTADNVDGIRQLRLRRPASSYKFQHLFAMEDPYGYMEEEVIEPGFQFVGENSYEFFERPIAPSRPSESLREFRDPSIYAKAPHGAVVERFFGRRSSRRSLKMEFDTRPKARYAFTWRGTVRSTDRELGIAGGELIVLDTHTDEVMGVRRGFAFFVGNWEAATLCPNYGYYGGFDKATGFTSWFTTKVARTPGWKALVDGRESTRRPRKEPK